MFLQCTSSFSLLYQSHKLQVKEGMKIPPVTPIPSISSPELQSKQKHTRRGLMAPSPAGLEVVRSSEDLAQTLLGMEPGLAVTSGCRGQMQGVATSIGLGWEG